MSETPLPDWQARAFAFLDVYAYAYTAWMRQAQLILDDLAVQLSRICGTHAHALTTSARHLRRANHSLDK